MANDLILYQYAKFDNKMQVPGEPIATEFITIGGAEVELDDNTTYIEVESKTTAFQFALGATGLAPSANDDDNFYVGSAKNRFVNLMGKKSGKFFKTVADA